MNNNLDKFERSAYYFLVFGVSVVITDILVGILAPDIGTMTSYIVSSFNTNGPLQATQHDLISFGGAAIDCVGGILGTIGYFQLFLPLKK